MILCIKIFHAAAVAEVRGQLDFVHFIDGRATAGKTARKVKQNQQADPKNEAGNGVKSFLMNHIRGNDLLKLAAIPRHFSPLMISRYGEDMEYGTHVDNALMGGLRTDLSFTLFLSEPATYEGGELVIESSLGEQVFKPAPGYLILYPSTTLHRVAPVTKGTRLAAVGWIQSHVRDQQQREILFDLETARAKLGEESSNTETRLLLAKTSHNLLRLWAEN